MQDGYLTNLVTAFSREQNEKVYVQHRLQEHSQELYEQYLSKNGVVYVCGDATQMARDVQACIRRIFEKYEGKSEEEAERMISAMKKSHRYQEDVWHST
jgi:sulfite reductase (NADPH) flavoprotein alpha-component